MVFRLPLLAAVVASFAFSLTEAKAAPIDHKPCPDVVYGKWQGFSAETRRLMGLLEIRPTKLIFERLGKFPYHQKWDTKGHSYLALEKPIIFPPSVIEYENLFAVIEYPRPAGPGLQCRIRFVLCESKRDLRTHLNTNDSMCRWNYFLPITDHERAAPE